MVVGDLDKSWISHVSCDNCRSTLEYWLRGRWRGCRLPYRECGGNLQIIMMHERPGKFQEREEQTSAIIPLHTVIQSTCSSHWKSSYTISHVCRRNQWFWQFWMDDMKPHLLNQKEVDDLMRDQNLLQTKSELLVSLLKEWNILLPSCRITKCRSRINVFTCYFAVEESPCYCYEINYVFNAIRFQYEAK